MGTEVRTRLGLWFVLAVALLSFNQVFESGNYPGPALLGALIATGIAIATRRLGLGSVTSVVAALSGLLLYLTLIFESKHTLWGLPTPEAISQLVRSLERAWEQSRIDFAPVPIRPGYEVMIVSALWIGATVGELASFRWRRPVLAILIPITLTSVAVVVGTGAATPFLALLFLAALLTYWGLESTHRMRSWGRWVTPWAHHEDAESNAMAGDLARRLGATCLTAALVSPLFLPTLGDGLVAWRSGIGPGGGAGGGGGGGLDPWVSIEPRLIEQSDTELFRVASKDVAYWRVGTLESFNGVNWEERGQRTEPVKEGTGDVEARVAPPLTHRKELRQTIEVLRLEGDAVPAAAVPLTAHRIDDDQETTEGIRFDPASANLFVEGDLDRGDRFGVRSAVPRVRYRQLTKARPGGPNEVAEVYLDPRVEITAGVDRLVRDWIDGAENPYEELVAIQTQLRRFDYSLNPPSARSNDYLTDFLLNSRTGFCQQYASAFALLARHLGYPSRVSVGFLPGDRDSVEEITVVRGTHAHAWPEIFFPEFGWIPFEPTPRGGAGAVPPAHTSEPIDGAVFDPSNPFSDLAESGRGSAAFGDVGEEVGGQDPVEVGGGLRGAEEPGGTGGTAIQAWQRTFGVLLRWLVLALLAFLLIVPLIKELRTRRRYAAATDPDSLAEAAFVHFQEEASELAASRPPWESASAYAQRMRVQGRIADNSAARLAQLYEAAAYAAQDITERQGEEARRLALRLRGQLWSRASWLTRAIRLFSPKRLGTGLRMRRRTAG
jgi:transglutaminase-like putative cysteine protease